MPKRRAKTAPDFQLLLILGAALVISGAAFAQDPEPESEAEATQQQDDEPEAAPAPAAADDSDDADDADDDDDAGDDEYADVEQPAEYADDAIPTDTQLDPTRTSWDVVEFEDDGDNQEDVEEAPHPGVREPEDMPTVRPHSRKAPPKSKGEQEDFLRSAGGRPIPDKGAPWQAEIYGPFEMERFPEKSRVGKALWQLQHYCGGTLIAHDWVLTAAHCIDQDMVNAGYRVRLGAEDISRDKGLTLQDRSHRPARELRRETAASEPEHVCERHCARAYRGGRAAAASRSHSGPGAPSLQGAAAGRGN